MAEVISLQELLSNPSLQTVDQINPDAWADDAVPPPPPGTYLFKATIVRTDKGVPDIRFGQTKQGVPYAMVVMDHVIKHEDQAYNEQSTREFASTLLNRNKTSRVDMWLRQFTGSAGVGMTAGQKVSRLLEYLNAEPEFYGDIDWELGAAEVGVDANGDKVYKTFYTSAKQFPVDAQGNPVALQAYPQTGEAARTRFKIVKIHHSERL